MSSAHGLLGEALGHEYAHAPVVLRERPSRHEVLEEELRDAVLVALQKLKVDDKGKNLFAFGQEKITLTETNLAAAGRQHYTLNVSFKVETASVPARHLFLAWYWRKTAATKAPQIIIGADFSAPLVSTAVSSAALQLLSPQEQQQRSQKQLLNGFTIKAFMHLSETVRKLLHPPILSLHRYIGRLAGIVFLSDAQSLTGPTRGHLPAMLIRPAGWGMATNKLASQRLQLMLQQMVGTFKFEHPIEERPNAQWIFRPASYLLWSGSIDKAALIKTDAALDQELETLNRDFSKLDEATARSKLQRLQQQKLLHIEQNSSIAQLDKALEGELFAEIEKELA